MLPAVFSVTLATSLALLPVAYAGFLSSSSNNVAIYWGQNSYGQGSGSFAQQRLSYYCANSKVDIIPIAFLTTIANPSLNFASAGDICTPIGGSSLFYCSEIEADIKECQNTYGKTILLSIGGATYTEGGFASSAAAIAAAENIWSIFGPKTNGNVPRPFGNSVIDGFDFDFESATNNMVPFANKLRSLMTTSTSSTGKKYFLTAAPQCPYPDLADGAMLDGQVYFDAIFVQFYNNYCGVQSFIPGAAAQNNFNFAVWDQWAKKSSLNPNVKVILGIPASAGAAGSGYTNGDKLASVISYCEGFSSFAGIMLWDMSQIYANTGFLDNIRSYLKSSTSNPQIPTSPPILLPAQPSVSKPSSAPTTLPASKPSSAVSAPTTMKTIVIPASPTKTPLPSVEPPVTQPPVAVGTVNQWNQCGGQDWRGGTVCKAPFTCRYMSPWYSQCE